MWGGCAALHQYLRQLLDEERDPIRATYDLIDNRAGQRLISGQIGDHLLDALARQTVEVHMRHLRQANPRRYELGPERDD